MNEAKKEWKWWYFVLSAAGLAAFAIFEYYHLAELETAGGSTHLYGIMGSLYNLLGKTGILVCGILASLFSLGVGLWKYRTEHSKS